MVMLLMFLLALVNKWTLKNVPLTSVVNKQQHRLWIVGNGTMDDWGSNKLWTHLQHDHKNDKVDSRMAVISDLKQMITETLLLKQCVLNEQHTGYTCTIITWKIFCSFYHIEKQNQLESWGRIVKKYIYSIQSQILNNFKAHNI